MVFLLVSSIFANAQNGISKNDGFIQLPGGVSYKLLYDEKGGVNPRYGDFVETHMYVQVDGKMIYSSREVNDAQPVSFLMQKPTSNTDLQMVIKLMTPGDSVVAMMSVDSMIKSGVQKLDWMKPNTGQQATYIVKMLSVKPINQKN